MHALSRQDALCLWHGCPMADRHSLQQNVLDSRCVELLGQCRFDFGTSEKP
jgi:hypothetical protein